MPLEGLEDSFLIRSILFWYSRSTSHLSWAAAALQDASLIPRLGARHKSEQFLHTSRPVGPSRPLIHRLSSSKYSTKIYVLICLADAHRPIRNWYRSVGGCWWSVASFQLSAFSFGVRWVPRLVVAPES